MPAINRRLILKLLLIRRQIKRLKRKPRSVAIRPLFLNRFQHGESFLLRELREDPLYHHKYFRMTKDSFDELLALIEVDISHPIKHCRPISPKERLALTLRYLATGNSQVSLALNYRFSPSSVSKMIREVIQALCQRLGPIYLPPPTMETWKKNEEVFNRKWNFPNACGAVDGKHIRIQAPALSGSTHFNYKNFFSIILMAIADGNYKFTAVEIGSSGSQSDGGVFSRSSMGKKLQNGTLGLPPPKLVEAKMMPHVILGDDAFPLLPSLMKPFPGKFLLTERRTFNYRMSRGRMVVENAFGILSTRWRIFLTTIIADLELTKKIVEAGVLLHNFCISKNDSNGISGDVVAEEHVASGSWRQDGAEMPELVRQGSNNYSAAAAEVRNDFMNYFISEGRVPWQESSI